MTNRLNTYLIISLITLYSIVIYGQNRPNILIVIADDMGIDAYGGYGVGGDLPITPNIDALAQSGIQFNNAWANPTCSPSRAAILTGKYANKNLVNSTGTTLALSQETLFEHITSITSNDYRQAAFGKWHIATGQGSATHPNNQGLDHYVGSITNLNNYNSWNRNVNGTTSNSTDYATTHITDEAINWIQAQSDPWVAWVAHYAPHTPIHLPPSSLYTRTNTNSNTDKYFCMIESVDHEFGRLYNSLSQAEKNNTIVFFMGDNGTPNSRLQGYPANHGKGSLYEGGIRVPFIVAGNSVSRINQEEDALVSLVDILATVTELLGVSLPGGKNNSRSFYSLLSDPNASSRKYNFSEYDRTGTHIAIRNEQYKLIKHNYYQKEFYDLIQDPLEFNDLLLGSLTVEQEAILIDLEKEAEQRTYSWSCRDSIQNGIETGIDQGTLCNGCLPSLYLTNNTHTNAYQTEYFIGAESEVEMSENVEFQSKSIVLEPGFNIEKGAIFEAEIDPCEAGIADSNCPNSNSTSTSDIGCTTQPNQSSIYQETVINDERNITTNNYPNHVYSLKQNNTITPVSQSYVVDATPVLASTTTSVLNLTGRPSRFFGVGLNGVKLAPAPATPFIFENTLTGEYNWDWVFEPTMNKGNGQGLVALDCSSAHIGPQGYHYHGNMIEYAEVILPGISSTNIAPAQEIQIGWASDGFPILYRFGPDENGNLKLLQPSYSLKQGNRPGNGESAPCGNYNGKYTQDYEYLPGLGDLDECNGVERNLTINTVEGLKTFTYFYVITDAFPQVGRCLSSTVNSSFNN